MFKKYNVCMEIDHLYFYNLWAIGFKRSGKTILTL